MADLLTGPIREGNRGGHGLFRWENVKEDKYRENYLGHSLRAPVGRWQKGRDLTWYAKGKKEAETISRDARAEEIRKIKEAEKDALAEALGFEVEKKNTSSATAQEIATAIHRTDKEAEVSAIDTAMSQANPAEGLGFRTKAARHHSPQSMERSTLNKEKYGKGFDTYSYESIQGQNQRDSRRSKRDRTPHSRHYRRRERSRERSPGYHGYNRYQRSRSSRRSP